MEFSSKEYHIKKTKNYTEQNNLFFFFNGVNKKSNDWINVEQELQKLSFSYYKILNKISKKALKNSIYVNVSSLINSVTFLLKPTKNEKEISKHMLINNFEPLAFILLAVKLNNKIYSSNQLSSMLSFKYEENTLIFFQYNVTNVKIVLHKSK